MTAELVAALLLLTAGLVALLELILAERWAPVCWAGPAFERRRTSAVPLDSGRIVAALSRTCDEGTFADIAFRELRPGFIAFREIALQRRPRLTYYPALRGHLRVERHRVTLSWSPNPSALLAAAGLGVWGLAPGETRAAAAILLLLMGAGVIVQAFRFARILRLAASAT